MCAATERAQLILWLAGGTTFDPDWEPMFWGATKRLNCLNVPPLFLHSAHLLRERAAGEVISVCSALRGLRCSRTTREAPSKGRSEGRLSSEGNLPTILRPHLPPTLQAEGNFSCPPPSSLSGV